MGDIVRNLIQPVPDGKLSRNPGDGKAGGLGGQGRAPGDPGVHFDHHHLTVFRVDGELDVGPTGLHPHPGDDLLGSIPHDLVFDVGEGLGRGYGDTVASVDAHGVQILNGADHREVVGRIPHDLQLVFLPAEHRVLDQDL